MMATKAAKNIPTRAGCCCKDDSKLSGRSSARMRSIQDVATACNVCLRSDSNFRRSSVPSSPSLLFRASYCRWRLPLSEAAGFAAGLKSEIIVSRNSIKKWISSKCRRRIAREGAQWEVQRFLRLSNFYFTKKLGRQGVSDPGDAVACCVGHRPENSKSGTREESEEE